MTTITIDGKSYTTKRTMLRKETKHVFDNLAFLANLPEKIAGADDKGLQELSHKINKMAPEEAKFLDDLMKACFGFTDEQLDEMENIHILKLFSELHKESTILKKTSDEQLKQESTGPVTPSS